MLIGVVPFLVIGMLIVLTLGPGMNSIPFGRVIDALAGQGTLAQRYFVNDVRLPRALVASLAGAALAVSGTIFQSLSRNPLGSSDVLGFNSGTAVVLLTYLLAYRGGVRCGWSSTTPACLNERPRQYRRTGGCGRHSGAVTGWKPLRHGRKLPDSLTDWWT